MPEKLLTYVLLCFCTAAVGQLNTGIVAKYTFNNNGGRDELGKNNAKIYNALPTSDRFGNADFACYLHGNISSYINLGSAASLKPRKGTISIWAKINMITYNGMGVPGNPIIGTKSHAGDDFNEAYSIGYNFNLRHMAVATSLSERYQAYVNPNKTTSLMVWHHVVMTYDNDYLTCYIDGVLEGKVSKGFESAFLEGDSVLVGLCIDKKNVRFLCGCVDDIEIYNRVLSEQEVLELYKRPNPNYYKIIIDWILYSLGILFFIALIFWLIRRYIRQAIQKEKEQNKLQVQWYEQENKVLKAQMNPHFIFNSLNTIQQFIILNDNKSARLYLSKFSRLLRKILETTTRDSISLQEEVELCKKYLEIESLRFNNVFAYSVTVKDSLDASRIYIPHFMVQVFVENAIWHGLLPKKGDKRLSIHFEMLNEQTLTCTIDDNGVGRKVKPEEPLRRKKSLAIHFIQQRLHYFSKIKNTLYNVTIIDKTNESGQSDGTRVIVKIPILTI